MKKIYKILYFLLIILPIFQVFYLGKVIGKIGDTPIPIVIGVSVIIIIISTGKFKAYRENKYIKYLVLYLIGVNIVSLVIYMFTNSNIYFLGENIAVKAIKGNIYFIMIYFYILSVNTFIKELNIKEIFKPFIFTSIVLFIILLWEIVLPESFNAIFHNGISYNRIRLLTYESSFTISMIFIYPIISIYYYKYIEKNTIKLLCIIGIMATFILTTGSKSILINLPIVILVMLIIFFYENIIKKKRKVNVLYMYVIILFIIMSLLILMPKFKILASHIENDLYIYTSLVTRFYTLIVSVICLIKFPFGTGNALYLHILPRELDKNLNILNNTPYNLSEIYSMIYSTNDKLLGVKSGIGQYNLYWGIIGLIIFLIYIFTIQRNIINKIRRGKYLILFLFIFIVIGISDFIMFDINYDIFAMFIIIQFLTRYYEKEKII